MFFTTAIVYMILGLPFLLRKKLKLSFNFISIIIHKYLLITGIILFILSTISLFYQNEALFSILHTICIATMAFMILKRYKEWQIAEEVKKHLE